MGTTIGHHHFHCFGATRWCPLVHIPRAPLTGTTIFYPSEPQQMHHDRSFQDVVVVFLRGCGANARGNLNPQLAAAWLEP